MSVRRLRYHGPLRDIPSQSMRTEIVEPVGGLNRQRPPTNLRPGETPFSQNVTMGDRYIEPRSGASSWGTHNGSGGSTGVTGTPGSLFVAYDSRRSEVAVLVSNSTLRQIGLDIVGYDNNWLPVDQASGGLASVRTDTYSTAALALLPSSASTPGQSLIIANPAVPPFVMPIGRETVTSDWLVRATTRPLTELYSIASVVHYVAAFDDRTVFFNSSTTSSANTLSVVASPTRVIWSARNAHSDFTNGGFQDLTMLGSGSGLVVEEDRLILLSDRETWTGRPRRDAYAFDFFSLDNGKGCPADHDRTPRATEAGTIWLGAGFQFYRAVGNEVRALGDKVREHLRDDMREWRHAFSVYNPTEHVYGLFYSDTTGEYATRALFLRTDTIAPVAEDRDDGVWFLQDFGSIQFNAGNAVGGSIALISSRGTSYRLLSAQTSDNGTAIDVRWRSHGMRAERDLFPYEMMQEVWLETDYDSAVTSTVSVYVSTDNGGSFSAAGSASVVSGIGYTQIPLSVAAARNAMFELRIADGTRPRIARAHVKLRGYTGRHGA